MTAVKDGHFHTTIKVTSDVRDRLKRQAGVNGLTLGEYLAKLADVGERQLRFEAMQAAIAAAPTDQLDSYNRETAYWDSLQQ